MKHDIVIIGGGPAGLAAAVAARKAGIQDILILERDSSALYCHGRGGKNPIPFKYHGH